MKKIFITALCLILILCTLTSCSRPPEYAEIEGRLKELVEASYEINDLLFGEGLEVYPRVYENRFQIYRDADDNVHYYYELDDAELGKIYAYRYNHKRYFIGSTEERSGYVYKTGGKFYYEIEGYDPEGKQSSVTSYHDAQNDKTYHFYTITDPEYGSVYEYRVLIVKYLRFSESEISGSQAIYSNANGYFYPIEYQEPEYEFYYSEDDPEDYSYVRTDSKYISIEQIKEAAEAVYSKQYLEGIYETLFTGVVISESESGKLGARYYDYQDSDGQIWLMESDKYESKIEGKRIYDFSTAKVLRRGSKNFVNIEIETYIEGKPNERVKVTLSMTRQDDGKWYLDSPTY